MKLALGGLAAIVVLGASGFFAYQKFLVAVPPPPPAKKAAPTAAAPKTAAPGAPNAATKAPPATKPLTPSETLNQVAHAPVNAVNKAKDAVAARQASGQAQVDAAVNGEDLADKPATVATAPGAKTTPSVPKPATASTALRPGLSATTEVEAAVEASPAFRSFVANAKVNSVLPSPPRAFINGRLTRSGDMIDSGLGIIFDTVDPEKRLLVFRDKSGATVARKY